MTIVPSSAKTAFRQFEPKELASGFSLFHPTLASSAEKEFETTEFATACSPCQQSAGFLATDPNLFWVRGVYLPTGVGAAQGGAPTPGWNLQPPVFLCFVLLDLLEHFQDR